jgi:hypothetical protein
MKIAEPRIIRYRCGNEYIGCGQPVEWNQYNNAANACYACCGRAARKWGIGMPDLPSLTLALHNARAGKLGEDGDPEEVWKILTMLKVERKIHVPQANTMPLAESQLPEADRQEPQERLI